MRILFDIGHPAHVHVFKNIISILQSRGHDIEVTARDKECTLSLLDKYGISYTNLGKNRKGLLNKAIGLIEFDYRLFRVSKRFKPDIFISKGTPYAAHISKVMSKPHIAFEDTEHDRSSYLLMLPFTDVICTPACFKKRLDPRKHIRFNGYFPLTYLHPNYFKPNPSVLDELGLTRNDKFFVLRFVSWNASHDIGQKGLSMNMIKEYITKLKEYGKVLITSESPLPKDLEEYRILVSPDEIHDLLYYATMYIGEGATMATEAGLLGTPSVYISSLVGTMGNFDELEKYGVVRSYTHPQIGLDAALQLLENTNLKGEWKNRKEKLLSEKIDVTAWMVDFIERFPKSFQEAKNKNV